VQQQLTRLRLIARRAARLRWMTELVVVLEMAGWFTPMFVLMLVIVISGVVQQSSAQESQ